MKIKRKELRVVKRLNGHAPVNHHDIIAAQELAIALVVVYSIQSSSVWRFEAIMRADDYLIQHLMINTPVFKRGFVLMIDVLDVVLQYKTPNIATTEEWADLLKDLHLILDKARSV